MPPTIRAATEQDLERVRDLLVETWHDTYDSLMGHDKVVEMTGLWHSPRQLATQLAAPAGSFLVAEADARIVGHAYAQAPEPDRLIVRRLYVLPDRQGQGIGAALLADLRQRHPTARQLQLTVEAGNARAVSFYRREGFSISADAVEGGVKVLRMTRACE